LTKSKASNTIQLLFTAPARKLGQMYQKVVTLLLLVILRMWLSPAWAESTVSTSHGPGGGDILVLLTDPQTPSTLYAGTTDGLFKSWDGGMTWFRSAGLDRSVGFDRSGLPFGVRLAVSTLVIDPQTPRVIYAGAPLCPIGAGCVRGVFKSMDGGTTWSKATGLPAELSAESSSLAIDPQNPTTLYAGTRAGLFKSTDGGIRWADSGLAGIGLGFVAISPQNASIVYAATSASGNSDGRLFRSMDGGRTWNVAYSSLAYKDWGTNLSALAVDPQDALTVYVADERADMFALFKSTDGGTTWITLGAGPRAQILVALTVDPQRPSVVYAGTNFGVFKSTDAGMTWNPVSSSVFPNLVVTAVAINPQNPSRVYAGFGTRVFEITFESPVLALDSTKYCIGASWNLSVLNGTPDYSIRVLGTSNSQSWEIPEWRKTDANGNFRMQGTFAGGSEGSHSLSVEIAGRFSDPIPFVVSHCTP
jgi:photosystem II stability/assembly factor-like uncharacterized protein